MSEEYGITQCEVCRGDFILEEQEQNIYPDCTPEQL
jgi:hypothetical protein